MDLSPHRECFARESFDREVNTNESIRLTVLDVSKTKLDWGVCVVRFFGGVLLLLLLLLSECVCRSNIKKHTRPPDPFFGVVCLFVSRYFSFFTLAFSLGSPLFLSTIYYTCDIFLLYLFYNTLNIYTCIMYVCMCMCISTDSCILVLSSFGMGGR
jgi:hypothetical protein